MIKGRKQWIWSFEGTRFGLVHQSGLVRQSLPPHDSGERTCCHELWISPLSVVWVGLRKGVMDLVSHLYPPSLLTILSYSYAPGVSDVFINYPWPTSTHRISISTAKEEAFATASRWQDVIFGMTRNHVWMFVSETHSWTFGSVSPPMVSTYLIYL